VRFQKIQTALPRRQFSTGGGFFSNLKKQVEQELAKSKELKEGMDKLKHDKSLKQAAHKAEGAASKTAQGLGSMGSKAKDAAQRAAEKAKEAAEKAAQAAAERSSTLTESGGRFSRFAEKVKSFGGAVGTKAKTTAEAASERSEKLKETVGEKVSKAASEASETSFARQAAERLKTSNQTVSKNPYVQTVVTAMKDAKVLEGWGDAARELMGKKKTMRTVKVATPPDMAPPREDGEEEEEEEEKDAYTGTAALMSVEAEKSNWEKFSERLSRTPIIEDVLDGAKRARRVAARSKVGKAAGKAKSTMDDMKEEARERWETSQNPWVYRLSAAYDATFAETETAQCINEVRRLDPGFNVDIWLEELRDDTIPHVINSYLRMDDDSLKADLSEGAFAQVAAAIKQARTAGLTMDPNLLHMNDPDLIAAQLVDRGPPIFVCSVLAQQINCFRNVKTGKIAEGAEDDIRYVFYIFALQRDYNEQLAELEWKVVEMRVQMMDPMI